MTPTHTPLAASTVVLQPPLETSSSANRARKARPHHVQTPSNERHTPCQKVQVLWHGQRVNCVQRSASKKRRVGSQFGVLVKRRLHGNLTCSLHTASITPALLANPCKQNAISDSKKHACLDAPSWRRVSTQPLRTKASPTCACVCAYHNPVCVYVCTNKIFG